MTGKIEMLIWFQCLVHFLFFFLIYRESTSPYSDQNYRINPRESRRIKQKKVESETIYAATDIPFISAHAPLQSAPGVMSASDETWWKNYFERKLELEQKRMEKEEERHKDRMNFQKMAIMLQERVEKIKVEAMNNLTNALLRLQESGKL